MLRMEASFPIDPLRVDKLVGDVKNDVTIVVYFCRFLNTKPTHV